MNVDENTLASYANLKKSKTLSSNPNFGHLLGDQDEDSENIDDVKE
jgi:hypothetical protein